LILFDCLEKDRSIIVPEISRLPLGMGRFEKPALNQNNQTRFQGKESTICPSCTF
jgi:hypothetical protein